jgi:hypothetical protein
VVVVANFKSERWTAPDAVTVEITPDLRRDVFDELAEARRHPLVWKHVEGSAHKKKPRLLVSADHLPGLAVLYHVQPLPSQAKRNAVTNKRRLRRNAIKPVADPFNLRRPFDIAAAKHNRLPDSYWTTRQLANYDERTPRDPYHFLNGHQWLHASLLRAHHGFAAPADESDAGWERHRSPAAAAAETLNSQ